MKKENKNTIIEKLSLQLEQYGGFYLTDIEGLDAAKTTALRRACFKQGVTLVVVKNTLLRKAMEKNENVDFSPVFGSLVGNTAIMFSETINAPARLIKNFTKDTKGEGKPHLKAAFVQDCFYIGQENLEALVNLKSREELIGDLLSLLQSPIKTLVSALNSGGSSLQGVLKALEQR